MELHSTNRQLTLGRTFSLQLPPAQYLLMCSSVMVYLYRDINRTVSELDHKWRFMCVYVCKLYTHTHMYI